MNNRNSATPSPLSAFRNINAITAHWCTHRSLQAEIKSSRKQLLKKLTQVAPSQSDWRSTPPHLVYVALDEVHQIERRAYDRRVLAQVDQVGGRDSEGGQGWYHPAEKEIIYFWPEYVMKSWPNSIGVTVEVEVLPRRRKYSIELVPAQVGCAKNILWAATTATYSSGRQISKQGHDLLVALRGHCSRCRGVQIAKPRVKITIKHIWPR